jgi:anti-sigma B factor antagonist
MRIDTTVNEGIAFMEVSGELDLAAADELTEAGLAALTPAAGTLLIDLSGVTFIDSTSLGALVAIRNAAEPHHTVVVQNAQPHVRRVFELTGLDRVFDSHVPAEHSPGQVSGYVAQ